MCPSSVRVVATFSGTVLFADEFLLKIFEGNFLGKASKFCVPAKHTVLP
jgi:hypothetical protein